jgi:predicted GNAT family acetyltransferase
MFLLSNARAVGLVDHGAPKQGTYTGAFEDDALTGVASHFWNGVVAVQAPRGLAEVVRAAVSSSGRAVKGLAGPAGDVRAARSALGLDGAAASLDEEETLYTLALERLRVPDPLSEGRLRCRHAREEDAPLLLAWRRAYHLEILGATDSPELLEECRSEVARLAGDDALWLLEEDRTAVATTAFNARLPEIVQVGGVYTPPELRGRGYARAAVAGSLLEAGAQGATGAVLFTSSSAAARAYEALGFARTGSFGLVLFA